MTDVKGEGERETRTPPGDWPVVSIPSGWYEWTEETFLTAWAYLTRSTCDRGAIEIADDDVVADNNDVTWRDYRVVLDLLRGRFLVECEERNKS